MVLFQSHSPLFLVFVLPLSWCGPYFKSKANLPPSSQFTQQGDTWQLTGNLLSIVCNPMITLLPNEETVIQSLSLYLKKTDSQLYDPTVCLFRQITASLGSKHCAFWGSSLCFHNSFALICCFPFLVMYSPSPVPLNAECCGLNLTENRWIEKGIGFILGSEIYAYTVCATANVCTHTHKTWIVVDQNISKGRSETLRFNLSVQSAACFWKVKKNQSLPVNK